MKREFNKTYVIIGLIIVLVGVISLVAIKGNLPTKLSASVSDLNSNGVKIYCEDNTIKVNKEMKCFVVGYLDDEITSIDGLLTSSSNLEVFDISNTTNFNGSIDEGKISFYSMPQTKGKFDIATFTLRALKVGNGQIKFTDALIGDSDFKKVEVKDAVYGIQVVR